FDGFEVGEVLSFVVASAAREKRTAPDAWLERRRFPKLERLWRLHVVVAIDHEVPAARRFLARRFCHDDRIAGGGAKLRVESDSPAMLHQPLRARLHVLAMLRLRGNAGEADVIAKFIHEARL